MVLTAAIIIPEFNSKLLGILKIVYPFAYFYTPDMAAKFLLGVKYELKPKYWNGINYSARNSNKGCLTHIAAYKPCSLSAFYSGKWDWVGPRLFRAATVLRAAASSKNQRRGWVDLKTGRVGTTDESPRSEGKCLTLSGTRWFPLHLEDQKQNTTLECRQEEVLPTMFRARRDFYTENNKLPLLDSVITLHG